MSLEITWHRLINTLIFDDAINVDNGKISSPSYCTFIPSTMKSELLATLHDQSHSSHPICTNQVHIRHA